jgi:hypothetical protein
VGRSFFPCTFTVLEKNDVDFLFGLDMLKRHQCVIDLKKAVLQIGSAGEEVPFLSEKDLPHSARGTFEGGDDDSGSSGKLPAGMSRGELARKFRILGFIRVSCQALLPLRRLPAAMSRLRHP